MTVNPEPEEIAHALLFSTSGIVSLESCGLGDLCQELLSPPELRTLTPASPRQPRTPIIQEKKKKGSEKWSHSHVPQSCLPLNKNKLTAEPWDSFLVFTPYKNFIDP